MTLNNNHLSEQAATDTPAMPAGRTTAVAVAPEPAEAPPNGAAAADASSVARAEQIADRLAERCAEVTSACVRKLAWLTARAREAAEDLWAEAQSIRRKE